MVQVKVVERRWRAAEEETVVKNGGIIGRGKISERKVAKVVQRLVITTPWGERVRMRDVEVWTSRPLKYRAYVVNVSTITHQNKYLLAKSIAKRYRLNVQDVFAFLISMRKRHFRVFYRNRVVSLHKEF